MAAMPELVCPEGFHDRLDRALPHLIDGLSRTQARRLIDAGSVFVDGRRCRVASRMVHPGATLRLETIAAVDGPPRSAAPPAILYEDADCLAIDKPSGMPSAPTRQAAAGSALDEMRAELRHRGERAASLWLVHRLDRETSGVLLFARSRDAAVSLDAAFRQRRVEKEYVAWVGGALSGDAGEIDASIQATGTRARIDPRGQRAHTAWSVIERRVDRTLLRLLPSTGRMHQLRVHLASIGHPVAGDRLYAGPPAQRLLLHAARLRFPHPKDGAAIEIAADLPPSFEP